MHEAMPFAEGEMVLRRTPLGFVDSVWEVFGALLAGIPYVSALNVVMFEYLGSASSCAGAH